MTDDAPFAWAVVVPVKVLAHAKSRIAPLAGPRRAELALAMASDTVASVRSLRRGPPRTSSSSLTIRSRRRSWPRWERRWFPTNRGPDSTRP